VIEGSADTDWADPRAEGQSIINDLPDGLGELVVLEVSVTTRTPDAR